jgi:hypothetical protein
MSLTNMSFRKVSMELGKDLIRTQDQLTKSYEKTGDVTKLRRDFFNLRIKYTRECLTAYATDLEESLLLSPEERKELLMVKLEFYRERFMQDLYALFKNAPFRNWCTLGKFENAGLRLVRQLSERL